MRAYYFDNLEGDQRLPHDSGVEVSDDILRSIGVLHRHIPIDAEGKYEQEVAAVAKERDYKDQDIISISKEGLGDAYEPMLNAFYNEHMHEEEEIRYLLEGCAFFDVREHSSERWIRCHTGVGDLLVMPPGIYHRFTLDMGNQLKAMRFFKNEPKWVAYNRGQETDANPYRLEYLKSIEVQ
ncbi:Acireductone dioxygenase [Rhizopogon vinicolor AM-OR11-026]|uniref:Acireductone dioxygenase n=1 Tax=Rhizopogon vinicolor AM-OR11-026 TaxID=1314800 RepID=A0A1B7MZ93_9AGAM|nr:Acireductone dioxygenase [Rhizopogon vinicolor AM-OR11-026]